jgi:RNA polymerase sigma-70 factor (ECF subfamily)
MRSSTAGGSRVEPISDAQLALRSRDGDRRAFAMLARRFQAPLFRFLRRLLGDEDAARDATQETLLKAWVSIGRLREPEHVRTWFHQIALNLCRDRRRSPWAAGTVPLEETGAAESGSGAPAAVVTDDPLQWAERRNLAAILDRALQRLPEEQRTAILLREVQGFTSAEIAGMTGAPAATVRSRIFYGLKALRRMLPEEGITGAHVTNGGSAP